MKPIGVARSRDPDHPRRLMMFSRVNTFSAARNHWIKGEGHRMRLKDHFTYSGFLVIGIELVHSVHSLRLVTA